MKSNYRQREVRFEVIDGCLVRTVTDPTTGKTYQHRCSNQVYETVAHAVDETPPEGAGTSLENIARGERMPFTQVNVALEFMKERGCVVTRGRRNYPASKATFEDAMLEYCFLAECPY